MGLLSKTLISLKGKILYKSFESTASNLYNTQKKLLSRIIKANANTEFGRLYNFSSINNEIDFQKKVPVFSYKEIKPHIEKIVNGEADILTSAQPIMFNMTSGTSGESKYIPITRESQKLTMELFNQWLYRTLLDHPSFLDNSILSVAGSAIEGQTKSGIPYGCASGMIYKNLPYIISRSYVVPYIVSEIDDYELRYYIIARLALASSISFAVTPNPSTLIRLAEIGIKYQESIVRSIHDGVLYDKDREFNNYNQKDIINKIESNIKPDPERAKFLSKVIEKHDRLLPAKCWPGLKLIACWLGGSVGFQADKLNDYYGDVPKRDLGLLASEGSITIPYKDNINTGILALQNNYYEFIPEENINDKQPPILLSHELEKGRSYYVILTTTSGLYRYNINDIVKVTGFYGKIPMLSFVRKGLDMTNITGEKMHINHFILAFDKIKSKHNIIVKQFRAVPNIEQSRYEIYLRMNDKIFDKHLKDIIPLLDKALSELNIEYKQKRLSKRLNAPGLYIMDDNWEEDIRRDNIKSGQVDAQYKWKPLCFHPHHLDIKHIKYSLSL